MKPTKGRYPVIQNSNAKFIKKAATHMEFSYEILQRAWREASKGKHEQENQAVYQYYLENNLYGLQERLEKKTFKPSPLRLKTILIPKYRIAQVPSLEDKIVQHAICDNYAYDHLTKPLIKETSACIKNRGSVHAGELLHKQLRRYWTTRHRAPIVLKCDIHSYFSSIPHKRLKQLIDRYILDEDVNRLMYQFVDMTSVGLPLGMQQSQLLANLYLSELDHRIKEELHVELYGRYMDDFYLLCDSREEAERYLVYIKNYVESVGLELNPKTDIFYNRVDYLGFKYFLTKSGKIIKRMVQNKKKMQKHRLRLLVRQIAFGEISLEKAAQSYFS